jgi:ubiquinone biosynthesis protein
MSEVPAMLELLTGIVIILVAVFVIRRLLGIDRGRWLITVGAVFAGEVAATAILGALYGGVDHVPAAGYVVGWAMVTIFAMLVVVLVELLSGPRRRGGLRGVPRPIKQLRSMIRRSLRYVEVASIVLRRGLLRPGGGADGDMGGSRLGRSLRLTFEDAGGLFVKLGQAMAQQPQLVTPPVAAELAFLHDSATPADPAAARAVITEELGPPENVFAEISSVPLGAASIGQTYSARLPDERDVVIKVQRPGVAESIECDLDILRRLAGRLYRRTVWARTLGLPELVAGFDQRTREELDFRIEGNSGRAARRALRDGDPICVPAVVDGLTTSRVLVQERAAGGSIGAPGAFDGWDPERRELLADALLGFMLRQMLAGGIFHADPHPGNVFIRPDGRLELIDFGAVGRLDPYERAGLIDLLRGLHSEQPSVIREGVLRIGTITRSIDEDALDRELARLLSRTRGANDTLNPQLFEELLFVLRDFGILLPRSTTTLFRTLVTLLGTLEVISPGYRVIDAAPRVGGEIVREESMPATPSEFLMRAAMLNATAVQRLPQQVDAISRRLLRGDLRMQASLLSDAEDVRIIKGFVNRIVMGLVASALALASALMLAANSPPILGFRLVNLLGGIGLFFSTLVLLRLLVQILRDRD